MFGYLFPNLTIQSDSIQSKPTINRTDCKVSSLHGVGHL